MLSQGGVNNFSLWKGGLIREGGLIEGRASK